MPTGIYIRTDYHKRILANNSLFKKGNTIAAGNHTMWKGDDVGYSGLHKWLKQELGKPVMCSNSECKYPRLNTRGKIMKAPARFEWANINHKYRRVLEDYISLCAKCHRDYDRKKRQQRRKTN